MASPEFNGNIVGNVSGNLTGNVAGNVTGSLYLQKDGATGSRLWVSTGSGWNAVAGV
jgi:hypothetical protein